MIAEKDSKVAELIEEINELRDSSSWLSNELEAMISLNEKLAGEESGKVDDLSATSERKRSKLIEQLKDLRLRNKSRVKANEFLLISRHSNGLRSRLNSAKSERKRSSKAKRRRDSSLLNELDAHATQAEQQPTTTAGQCHDYLLDIYLQLRQFQAALQTRRDTFVSSSYNQPSHHLYSPNSTDDSGISDDSKLNNIELADLCLGAQQATNANTKTKTGKPQIEETEAKEPTVWRQLMSSLKSLIEDLVSFERLD